MTKYGVVALSEGLRPSSRRGNRCLGLCPGFVRTQIVNSRRNVPQRFAGKIGTAAGERTDADLIKALRDRINQGIDPLYVGELVREGIENDWPYIFTDTEHEPFIDTRFAAIKQGFDRIRGRTPRR